MLFRSRAFIEGKVKEAQDILNKKVDLSKTGTLYREAGREIVKDPAFKTFSPKKQREAMRIAGNKVVTVLDDAEIPCIKGAGGNCTTPEDFKKGFNQVVERAAAGDKVAGTKINKFLKGMRKFKGPLKWTGWGLLGEAAFVIPFGVMDYAAGKSWKRILGNATDWGLGPMLGQSEQEEFEAALPEGSKAIEAQNIVDIGGQLDTLKTRARGPIVRGPRARSEVVQTAAYNKLIDEYNLN